MATEKEISSADETIEAVVTKPARVIDKAAKSKTGKMIGGIVFIIGFLLAVIAGLVNGYWAVTGANQTLAVSAMMGVMALIGLIVGLVNVSDKEAINFLIGAIAVTVAAAAMAPLASFGAGTVVVGTVTNFVAVFISSLMSMIAAFVAPAATIVGLKVVYTSARKA